MGLPPDYHTGGDIKKHEGIPLEVLKETLERRLGPAYEEAMLSKAKQDYLQSDQRFDEGRHANSHGDRFDLNTVVFTVSLFFAGLALVFRTRIRWYFLVAGLLIFIFGAIQLGRVPWA